MGEGRLRLKIITDLGLVAADARCLVVAEEGQFLAHRQLIPIEVAHTLLGEAWVQHQTEACQMGRLEEAVCDRVLMARIRIQQVSPVRIVQYFCADHDQSTPWPNDKHAPYEPSRRAFWKSISPTRSRTTARHGS